MSFIKRTFSTCESPRFVYNKYTGHLEYVPCRHCNSCSNTLGSVKSSALRAVLDNYRYAYMFTLTYDNLHLPRCRYFTDRNGTLQVTPIGRISDDYRYLPIFNQSSVAPFSDYNLALDEFLSIEHDDKIGEFGVVSRRDVQKFMKRFRFHLDKQCKLNNISNEEKEFAYYISSEYGPKTFRPHYHGIIAFDSPRLLDLVPTLITESWGLRRRSKSRDRKYVFEAFASPDLTYDYIKLCDGNTSSYVADYVSSSNSLPTVLQATAFRPFCLHSSCKTYRACESMYEGFLKSVSRGSITYRRGRIDESGSLVVDDVKYPRIVVDSLLRKCKGYRSLDAETKSLVYSFAYRYKDEWKEYVNNVYSYCKDEYKSFEHFLRCEPYYRFRSYVMRKHYDDYCRLLMFDDGVWYASEHAADIVTRYNSYFSFCGFYPTDELVKLIDRYDTLMFCSSVSSFCDVYNDLYKSLGNCVVFAAYPYLNVDFLPFYYRDFLTWDSPYKDLLQSLCLSNKIYKNGCLDTALVDSLSEFNLPVWQSFVDDAASREYKRNKSKYKNNSLLNGQRILS